MVRILLGKVEKGERPSDVVIADYRAQLRTVSDQRERMVATLWQMSGTESPIDEASRMRSGYRDPRSRVR